MESQPMHRGFKATGESVVDLGHEPLPEVIDDHDTDTKAFAKRECTILYGTGEYQRPNLTITDRTISVYLGVQVDKIQLRHVPSGATRFYTGGIHTIEPGEYVLSLWGNTYKQPFIKACVSYN